MRMTSYLRSCLYGSSLALALALAAPAVPSDLNTSGVVFAQQDSAGMAGGPAITPIRSVDEPATGVEARTDINGTLLAITYVSTAQEAEQVFFEGRQDLVRAVDDPQAIPYGQFLTNDMTGEPAFIILDLSGIADIQGGYVNVDPGQGEGTALRLSVAQQPNGTFYAWQFWELAEGNEVNNTDFGVREVYTTLDDSIDARALCNGPEDDEARSQGGGCDEDDDDDDEDDE